MSLALAGALILAALSGPEPDAATGAAKVRCEIQVIHATRGQEFVDPALKPLSRYLRNSFGSRYQSFRQLAQHNMVLAKSERQTQRLPNGTELLLTYLDSDESRLRLVMEVGGLKTTVRVHDGGLFFQAGRRHQGGMLIVAIRARSL